jgi:large subunit ribosomal protein L16
VAFGDFGLQALEPGWIAAKTIEAGRIACTRNAPEAKIWIRIFPHKSVSSKPAETRQGTGKGDIDYWCAVVRPGTMLYEIAGVDQVQARKAFNRVAHKLPVKVRMVRRRHL